MAYFCHGAYAIEVAVNIETGEVKIISVAGCFDMAQPINPQLCEAQMESGITMGIGHALYEEMAMSDGVILNPSFVDYKMPTAECLPSVDNIRVALAGTPHRDGPFGAKGFSEGVLTPMPAAVANAVYNAVGVRIKDLPITSEKVLKALKARDDASVK